MVGLVGSLHYSNFFSTCFSQSAEGFAEEEDECVRQFGVERLWGSFEERASKRCLVATER